MGKRDIKQGNLYYEASHYKVDKCLLDGNIIMKHLETGDAVTISEDYINRYLKSADNFSSNYKCNKSGIQEVFHNIPVNEVFTVCFEKVSTKLPKYKLAEKRTEEKEKLSKIIKSNRITDINEIIDLAWAHHVDPIEKGDDRVLRGYKTQAGTVNGSYQVIDVDSKTNDSLRQVNIRTIKWIIYGDSHYDSYE